MKDHRAEVIAKALKEPAFKAELIKDPKAALEKALGVKIPANVTIKVVEDSASAVHLVLPPSMASGALSEDALQKVSGGAAMGSGQAYPCGVCNSMNG